MERASDRVRVIDAALDAYIRTERDQRDAEIYERMPIAPSRGGIWYADVPMDKRRPVLIMTRDPMGRLLDSVICAPITRRVRGLSTEVSIGPETGLADGSVIDLDNTMLLHRTRLLRRMGRASADTMEAVCEALSIAVDCHWRSPAA